MRDFFNQPLAVGDVVAFVPDGDGNLVRGRIVELTHQRVRIAYTNTWNHGGQGRGEETLRYPSVVVKDLMGGWGGIDEQGG